MITIRLQRKGGRNKAFYRVVAMDHKNKLTGPALDIIGYWQPQKKLIKISKEKVAHWTKNGAQISPAVKELLTK